MDLTQTAEYALRAMSHLATLDEGASANGAALQAATGIPPAYLSKIMRKLVLAGLVTSQKGHGGGFALSRPPRRIRFLDVLEAAGYPLEADRCAFGWGDCNPRSPCPLHPAWSRLGELFLGWARETTLADARAERRRGAPIKLGARRSPARRTTR